MELIHKVFDEKNILSVLSILNCGLVAAVKNCFLSFEDCHNIFGTIFADENEDMPLSTKASDFNTQKGKRPKHFLLTNMKVVDCNCSYDNGSEPIYIFKRNKWLLVHKKDRELIITVEGKNEIETYLAILSLGLITGISNRTTPIAMGESLLFLPEYKEMFEELFPNMIKVIQKGTYLSDYESLVQQGAFSDSAILQILLEMGAILKDSFKQNLKYKIALTNRFVSVDDIENIQEFEDITFQEYYQSLYRGHII